MDVSEATVRGPAPDSGRRHLLGYWPEVDGLRSIAVLAVVLFHFDRSWLRGGFVGVDIFYVISGFLITALLLEDRERGNFSIARFYQRRIARIAPAFFAVLAATLAGAWWIYSDQDFASAGSSAAFAAISAANIKYMLIGDYFAISPDAQPFLHYWSLAVEEQFYLFFPFLLYALTRWTRHTLKITLALLVLSLALCVVMTWAKPVYAFYLLPTRGWELLAGAAVTMLRWRGIAIGDRMMRWLPWAGLALLIGSVLLIREGPSFPGAVAIFPVLGTAMILAAAGDMRAALNRWLARPLPVYIGKRSYSLYLWHWPVFSLVDYQLFASDGWTRGALKIGITLVLTGLSYALIERPARSFFNRPPRRLLAYGLFFALVAGFFVAGTAIRNVYFLDASPKTVASGGIEATRGTGGNIVLIGDSQASMYARDLGLLARQRGYSFHTLGIAAGEQLPDKPRTTWPQVWAYLASAPVDVVIIAEAWDDKLLADPAVLSRALDQLATRGIRVILVQQIPTPGEDATRDAIRHGVRSPFADDSALLADWTNARTFVAGKRSATVTVLDPVPLFRAADGSIRLVHADGRLNYQDKRHLSDTGTRQVIPLLDRAIAQALRR